MKLGETVTWDGRRYALRGLEPMSVPGRLADLEELATGERIRVPVDELEWEGDEGDVDCCRGSLCLE